MLPSIPASVFANVIPGVLGTGGNPLALNAVYLTSDESIPYAVAQPFASASDVADWFGALAPETILANVYFAGYTNCTSLPATLWFFQFNSAPIGAYLRGGSVAAMTLSQLQALSGTLAVSVDGQLETSAAINLSAATSFTNAATLIQAGLQSATARFSGTGSQAAGVVTIATTVSGSLAVGDLLAGAGVTSGGVITSFGTYTTSAGTGTVNVTSSATVSLGSVTVAGVGTVTFDALRHAFVVTSPTTGADSSLSFATVGALATGLKLTSAAGAVLSQGAEASTPAEIMALVVAATQNWATFMTVSEQTLDVKEAFAAWVQTTNQRYLYVAQDSDESATTNPNATGSFGNIVNAANDTGVMPVYDTSGSGVIAAFFTAIAAAINFAQPNGRATAAFRNQEGLVAQVTNDTVYENLKANGYNAYLAVATANQQFTYAAPGQISGPFRWFDNYIDQIYLNSQFQLALLTLLVTVPAVPYATRGYNLIRNALLDPINQALNFGSIKAGVTLSALQAAALNNAVNDPSATATIQNTGWYLQILDPGAIVRGNRGTPTITFYYTDGGSVQQITMSSVDVI